MEVSYGRVRSRGWTRVGHGLYVQGALTPTDELRALSLMLPARAAYTHLTAAGLYGWWRPGWADFTSPIFVAARKGAAHPQRRGVVVSRYADWPVANIVAGVRVVSPVEALLAASRDLGLLDLVQLGDSALRLKQGPIEDLAAAAAYRRSGAVQLRRLIPLLDARSESPWESVMRLLHQAADIAVEPQKKFFDPTGRFVARADLWVVSTNRVNEYDGADHRDVETHRQDLRRDRALIGIGLDRCGYTSAELIHGGGDIIASADRLLGRRWDPGRLWRWNALVQDSLFAPAGRARVRTRWKSAG